MIGGAARGSRVGWPQRLRNLGVNAAGKSAYVDTVRKLYRDDISGFNLTYGTRFDSFAALSRAAGWRQGTDLANPAETRDNTVFLQRTVDRYNRGLHTWVDRSPTSLHVPCTAGIPPRTAAGIEMRVVIVARPRSARADAPPLLCCSPHARRRDKPPNVPPKLRQ